MFQHPQHERKQFPCRRAAIFSDIHSNYHAFRACYDDALGQGADGFIFLGDYISDLADPVKTLDLVYEIQSQYPTVCLRGNRERYMLDAQNGAATFSQGSKTGSLLYTFGQLRPRDFEFIRGLAPYEVIGINGIPIELAHATRDDDRYYFEKADARIQTVFTQMECAWLLTGHSHRQYTHSHLGKTILNPGSVGIPQGGGRWPQYALLEITGGAVQCRFRQVPYDLRATIHVQFESGLVDQAGYWAISILYDVITGEERTMALLDRVQQRAQGNPAAIHDESLWRSTAAEMGMKFTQQEILAILKEEAP